MIKCPSCGANLKFKPSTQMLFCEFCRNTIKPEDFKRDAKTAREEGKMYKCTSCGGELLSYDETAVTFCSYCGQQTMIESQLIEKNNPEFIIPFQKEQEECIEAYKKYVSKSLFAPKYMKEEMTLKRFRGIYMPYAIYHFTHDGNTTNKGKKYSHRSGDYVYYDVFDVNADIKADYNGISYDLLSKFNDRYSEAIPFDYTKALPYSTNYIAGFYADSLDINPSTYQDSARQIAEVDASNKLRKDKAFRRFGCTNPKVNLEFNESKVGMFPVYFLSMLDKSKEHISYAVINGQTGKVVADLPIDFKKYILGSLILSILIFLFLNATFVLTPLRVLVIGIILGIISIILLASQLKDLDKKNEIINKSENNNGKKNKKSKENRFKYYLKPIVGILISILVIMMDLVDDIYYYAAGVGILVLFIWSVYDLVILHNKLTQNKIPQLESRGGDENA